MTQLKWAMNLNRVIKIEKKMAMKHLKKLSSFLAIMKIQIK